MKPDLPRYAKYSDSALPWLGPVPSHWRVVRAKWLFKRVQRLPQPEDEVVTCFRDGVVTLRKNRRVSGFTEAVKESGYQRVVPGELVIHVMDAFAGAVGVSDSTGKCTPVYLVCQPISDECPDYFARIIREMARTQWIAALAKGIRERSSDFRFETFGAQSLPVPPRCEQLAIVRFLNGIDGQIRELVRSFGRLVGANRSATERDASLFFEYRTAMTAAVVTGKLDVREAAARLLEVDAEQMQATDVVDEVGDDESTDTHEAAEEVCAGERN
jgi:type I restriction enzyme S subunit